jgi:hypothetical protein
MTDVELAEFFARRPELADPPPGTFADLATRASAPYSLQACLAQLRTPVREVIDALSFLGEAASLRDIADLAGTPTDTTLLGEIADEARRLGLVQAHEIHPGAPKTYTSGNRTQPRVG